MNTIAVFSFDFFDFVRYAVHISVVQIS